ICGTGTLSNFHMGLSFCPDKPGSETLTKAPRTRLRSGLHHARYFAEPWGGVSFPNEREPSLFFLPHSCKSRGCLFGAPGGSLFSPIRRSPAGLSLAQGAISNLNLHRGKADFLTDWNLLTILYSIFHVQ